MRPAYSDDHEPIYEKHKISMIEGIIQENVEVIKDRWNEYFKK
jgi:hypothetical protein